MHHTFPESMQAEKEFDFITAQHRPQAPLGRHSSPESLKPRGRIIVLRRAHDFLDRMFGREMADRRHSKGRMNFMAPNGSIIVFYARYGLYAPVEEQKCLFVIFQYHIFPSGN